MSAKTKAPPTYAERTTNAYTPGSIRRRLFRYKSAMPASDPRPARFIAAPPDTFALITRPEHDDTTMQQWFMETVVAFDAEDGGAYVVGGLNRTGNLKRLDEVIGSGEFAFAIAAVWEQYSGGREAAREWAGRHIKALYEDALPMEPDDPRRQPPSS